MSSLIKRSLLLVVILLIHFSVIEYILPYYWGASATVSRHILAEQKIKNADLLFVGSSRTLYHIDAALFSRKTKTKAYNLGIQQGRLFEMINQVSNLVYNALPSKKTRYIVFELCPFENLQPRVMHTNRIRHFWNYKTYFKSIRYNLITKNYQELKRSTYTFLEHFFKVDVIKEFFLVRQHSREVADGSAYGVKVMEKCNGCFLNPDFPISRPVSKNKAALREKRIQQVKARELRFQKYYDGAYPTTDKEEREKIKAFVVNEIDQLNNLVKKKGFELLILNQTGSKQIDVFKALQKKNYKCIDLGNPYEYPEFYSPDIMFDMAHMTVKGNKKFTLELSKEFNEIIKKQ